MSIPPLIFGPIPPYSNPPINPQYFQPSQFIITSIALGSTTTVTTAVNHNYVIGQEIRLLIPNGFGSTQLNELTGFVIGIPASNQVIVNINSENANSFINASLNTKSQIIAIGDINTGIISSTGRSVPTTNIPGSFINTSPT